MITITQTVKAVRNSWMRFTWLFYPQVKSQESVKWKILEERVLLQSGYRLHVCTIAIESLSIRKNAQK